MASSATDFGMTPEELDVFENKKSEILQIELAKNTIKNLVIKYLEHFKNDATKTIKQVKDILLLTLNPLIRRSHAKEIPLGRDSILTHDQKIIIRAFIKSKYKKLELFIDVLLHATLINLKQQVPFSSKVGLDSWMISRKISSRDLVDEKKIAAAIHAAPSLAHAYKKLKATEFAKSKKYHDQFVNVLAREGLARHAEEEKKKKATHSAGADENKLTLGK